MSNNVIEFYNQYLDSFPITDPSAVGWTDKKNQHTRFKVLFDIGITDYNSVLDYGCGLGHLNGYMELNDYSNIKYIGIDINPHYIGMARLMYKDKIFIVSDIEGDYIKSAIDYVIGSGVFTYGVTIDEVISKIETAYNIANIGVAFNFLSNESGLDELLTYDKKEIVNRLSHIGNINLIENYLGKEDFTIYINK